MSNKEFKKEEPRLEVNKIKNIVKDAKEVDKKNQSDNNNKPTDEEIQSAQNDFESAAADFSKYKWDICQSENAQKLINYALNFVHNKIYWTKNSWMGVIKFKEELDEAQQLLSNKEIDTFKMGYQAIEFGFYSLSNPGGIGYESAKKMESDNDVFVELLEGFGTALEDARARLEDVNFLQGRWASMSQGFYFEQEDGVEQSKKQESNTKDPSLNKDAPINKDAKSK